MEEGLTLLKREFHLKEEDAAQYSPLVLAYMGDAVYELMIRTLVVNQGNAQVNKLHKRSAGLVKAEAQARMALALQEDLNGNGAGGVPQRQER